MPLGCSSIAPETSNDILSAAKILFQIANGEFLSPTSFEAHEDREVSEFDEDLVSDERSEFYRNLETKYFSQDFLKELQAGDKSITVGEMIRIASDEGADLRNICCPSSRYYSSAQHKRSSRHKDSIPIGKSSHCTLNYHASLRHDKGKRHFRPISDWNCRYCFKELGDKVSLHKHQSRCHDNPDRNDKVFECRCLREFANKGNLQRHQDTVCQFLVKDSE